MRCHSNLVLTVAAVGSTRQQPWAEADTQRRRSQRHAHLRHFWHVDCHVEVPPPARVLAGRPQAKFVENQTLEVPQSQHSPAVPHLTTLVLIRRQLERDPAQRVPSAPTGIDTPGELGLAALASPRAVLGADGLQRMRVQRQAFLDGPALNRPRSTLERKRRSCLRISVQSRCSSPRPSSFPATAQAGRSMPDIYPKGPRPSDGNWPDDIGCPRCGDPTSMPISGLPSSRHA